MSLSWKKKIFMNVVLAVLIPTTSFANEKLETNVIHRNQTPMLSEADWFKRIKLSGLILTEAIYSNYNAGTGTRFGEKKSYSILCFPRANLNVDAELHDGIQAKMAFNFRHACGYGSNNDEWAFVKFDKVDEIHLDFYRPNETPYFARFGIQYLPYGHYTRHQIPATFTQLLTQTQAPALLLGYQGNHAFHTSVYLFSGKKKTDSAQRIQNAGLQVGYTNQNWAITLDWMHNIAGGVNYIVASGDTSSANMKNPLNTSYQKVVSGIHTGISFQNEHFDALMQYTTALTKFDSYDLNWQGKGAKPSAAIVGGGYHFLGIENIPTRIGGSYQQSWQAVHIRGSNKNLGLNRGRGLPKHRFQIDTSIEPWKNITAGIHFVFDKDYSTHVGGTGRHSWTTLLTFKASFG